MAKDYQNLPTDKLSKMALKGDPAASEELGRRYNTNGISGEDVFGTAFQNQTSVLGMLRHIWKKILVPVEPACLSLLLYIFYLLLYNLYFFFDGSESFEKKPGIFLVLLLLILLFGRIISGWVHLASRERPLSIFLVLVAMMAWYSMAYHK